MLEQFTSWLLGLLKQLFADLWEFISDALLGILDVIITAFVTLVSAIPVPDFLGTGLGSVFAQLDSGVLWLVTQAGVPQGLAVLGLGYAFRLLRKFLTLFQW